MNRIRTTPTASEQAAIAARPAEAFGFCILTPAQISVGPEVAVLDRPYKLHSGWGINVIATGDQMSTLWQKMADFGLPRQGYHLLRETGTDLVPVYDRNSRGATGLPLKTTSISVPR